MSTVVSFAEARHKRRAEALAIEHGEHIAEKIRQMLHEHGSDEREDLWYLSRMIVHGVQAIGRNIKEYGYAPKLRHTVGNNSRRVNASNKTYWSCNMSDRKNRYYEVFRFCLKVAPDVPHRPKGYVPNTHDWYIDTLDAAYKNEMLLADAILHSAYRAALLSLFIAKNAPGSSLMTIEPMDEAYCFQGSGLRQVGDYVVCEAHRKLPNQQRLVVTGFYNLHVVNWLLEKDLPCTTNEPNFPG